MKEAAIRKKVIDILDKQGFICWYPYHVHYKKEVDVFGAFDLIAWHTKKFHIKFIQLTTLNNMAARTDKVRNFIHRVTFDLTDYVNIEIWGWDDKHKEFRIKTP